MESKGTPYYDDCDLKGSSNIQLKPINNVDAVQRITRRLDSIGERDRGVIFGLSWYYIKLICLTGVGWAMDSMETFVFIFTGGLIGADIEMSVDQYNFLSGAVFVGSLFGSFIFGSFMDIYGRKPMFQATLIIFLLGLGACGFSWNITVLTIFRIIGGIGLGGELPVASTLVQELAPKKTRGRIIVLLESFWATGVMLAIVLAFGVAPSIGWRETFYLCCLPVVYCIFVRLWIPESPKWLASVGRYEEAVAIVESIEKAHGLEPMTELIEDGYSSENTFVVPQSHLACIALLFRKQFLVRSTVLQVLWFGISMGYYAIFIHLPGLVATAGYDINANWERIFFVTACQLPGYFSAAVLVEYLGRKNTLVLYLVGTFFGALLLGYTPKGEFVGGVLVDDHRTQILTACALLSFFLLGAWGCVYSYTPENYPTAIRGIGSSYPAGTSRIGAFFGPYLCSYMINSWGWGIEGIMWFFGAVILITAATVYLFGYEPKGQNIETYEPVSKE